MKILVPTDFSGLSEIAVRYAAQLARTVKAELVLLHTLYIDAPPRAQAALHTGQILTAMADNAASEFKSLLRKIQKQEKKSIKVSFHIIKGFPLKRVIDTFAIHHDIDLIIMGTKGASGLKKIIMGSNTAAVIRNSSIPVLAIPEHARYRKILQVVYASDMQSVSPEIKKILSFAKPFGAHIYLLHVLSPRSRKKLNRQKTEDLLKRKYKYPGISVHIEVDSNVEETINKFIAGKKADILVMFTHRRSFFKRLLSQSVTRQMAFYSWIPLLALKK